MHCMQLCAAAHMQSICLPFAADWEEEWEEAAASVQDDPALWTREAYRVSLPGWFNNISLFIASLCLRLHA